MRKKIILTIVALVLVPLFMWHFLGDTTAEMNPNCELPRYVKIGEHVLKFTAEDNIYLRKDGDNIGAKCLQTTQSNPVEVDRLQFAVSFPTETLKGITLKVIMSSNLRPSRNNEEYYKGMLNALRQQGKSIENLPKKDDFYTDIYNQAQISMRYFASQDHLKDAIGVPLMLEGCADGLPLTCRALFRWVPDIKVFMSSPSQHHKLEGGTIKIWDEIYMRAIEAFNQKIAD